MRVYDLKELVQIARQKSPYYKRLYQGISGFEELSELPVVDQAEFWEANTINNNRVVTASIDDGIVFKSGGTTGNPKFSVYSRDEWELFTKIFGDGLSKSCLSEGDRIANLFYVGELYASFIFIMKSLELSPTRTLQFPISGSTKAELILTTACDFQVNVLAGLPTTLLNIAECYAQNKGSYPALKVNKILFGGESMYPDQRKRLDAIFPGVKIVSIGYASVDAGPLGYADESCGPDEHRVFGKATIFEIVDDETHAPINEVNRPGKVLVTNLIRPLMPIIRYPAGDRAIWVEPASKDNPDRKFVILGRSEEAARVGPVSVYYEDMRAFLEGLDMDLQITGFQLIIRHFEMKDALVVRIASPHSAKRTAELDAEITRLFGAERKMFAEAAAENKIHPLFIEWTDPSDVEINSRTGKLRRVIDQRH